MADKAKIKSPTDTGSMLSLKDALVNHRLQKYQQGLESLGVENVYDLLDVLDDDLQTLGMTKVERNRYHRMCKQVKEVGSLSAMETCEGSIELSTMEMSTANGSSTMMETNEGTETPSIMETDEGSGEVPSLETSAGNGSSTSMETSTGIQIPSLMETCEALSSAGSEEYHLKYYILDCAVPKQLDGLNPNQHTIHDLIEIILRNEAIRDGVTAQIYSIEGTPITCDVFLNRWTLKKREISSGSVLFVIFHLNGLRDTTIHSYEPLDHTIGSATLNVHVMLGDTYKIKYDSDKDTVQNLRQKIWSATGIETSCQLRSILDGAHNADALASTKFKDGEMLDIAVASETGNNYFSKSEHYKADVKPCTEQTKNGLAVFYSVLYVVVSHNHSKRCIKKLLAFVRKLSGCPPLVATLEALLGQRSINFSQKVAVVEGLYFLFRRILPTSLQEPASSQHEGVPDNRVFEHSAVCWAYILQEFKTLGDVSEEYSVVNLACPLTWTRFREPVRIQGIDEVWDKSAVLQQIQANEPIMQKELPKSAAKTLEPAGDIQRFLLCWGISTTICYEWNMPANYKPECMDIKGESLRDLSARISSVDYLTLYPPLKLKDYSLSCPRLTLNSEAHMVVYTGPTKGVKSSGIWNPISMENENVDLDEMALSLKDYPFSDVSCSKEAGKGSFTREPIEAIVVLFDTSSSMNEICLGEGMTRIDATKQLFHAFANRSMAYNFAHIIALTQFDSYVTVVEEFTEAFESFKQNVNELVAVGQTRMYDAIVNAVSQLDEIGVTYPNCTKRILCLTDGEDQGSKTTYLKTAKALQASKVCLDSVLVGYGNDIAKCLSKSSGGCCFNPVTMTEGLKLFEMETVLSLNARKDIAKKSRIATKADLHRYSMKPYDKQPPHKVPDDITKPVSPAHVILNKVSKSPPIGGTTSAPIRVKRILRELSAYQRSPHACIHLFPCEDNVGFWRILLVGPPDTPYEGGVFLLYADFTKNYPVAPPVIRFITPIYHCNVNAAGRICHSVFDRDYTSDTSIYTILVCIFGLLITPEPDDPLDSTLAEEYFASKETYYEKARSNKNMYASKTLQQHQRAMLGSEERGAKVPLPQHLKCPLTNELFVDPVGTPYGHVYERYAIEASLSQSAEDPIARQPLGRELLKTDTSVKKLVEDFRSSRIKSDAWWQSD